MDVLIGGIEKYLLESGKVSLFDRLGYSGVSTCFEQDIESVREVIRRCQNIDLMLLSGWEADEYGDYYNIAVENPSIPSILVAANCDQTVLNWYKSVHPPNHTCYFSELLNITREQMDSILTGKSLEWSFR